MAPDTKGTGWEVGAREQALGHPAGPHDWPYKRLEELSSAEQGQQQGKVPV